MGLLTKSVVAAKNVSCNKQLAQKFNFTSGFIDDILSLNNSKNSELIDLTYPCELEIKVTTESRTSASYLDFYFYIDNGKIVIRLYVGWSGGAKALGKLPVLGRPTNVDDCGTRAYCAYGRCGWGLFGHFSIVYHFSLLSPFLWETARWRVKYCLKGPLNTKQPTN